MFERHRISESPEGPKKPRFTTQPYPGNGGVRSRRWRDRELESFSILRLLLDPSNQAPSTELPDIGHRISDIRAIGHRDLAELREWVEQNGGGGG